MSRVDKRVETESRLVVLGAGEKRELELTANRFPFGVRGMF